MEASTRPEQIEHSSCYNKTKWTFALGLVLLECSLVVMIGEKQIGIPTAGFEK